MITSNARYSHIYILPVRPLAGTTVIRGNLDKAPAYQRGAPTSISYIV